MWDADVLLECTTLVHQKSPAISVCGGVDNDQSATARSDIAAFANQIQQTYNDGVIESAGSMYTFSASKRVKVIHSSLKDNCIVRKI